MQGMRQKVVQITSPSPGDGSTTLAANLAASIAQSGKRVLLIDADLRNPSLHKIFGVSNDAGLVSVVRGENDLPDAIQESEIPGLWLLPAGAPPVNPADLLASPRLPELLQHLREVYDVVLVDTPALLAATDAHVVATCADGVLLTIRIGNGNRPKLERAREILGTLGANLLGAVVNAGDLRFEFAPHSDHHGHFESWPDYPVEGRQPRGGNGREPESKGQESKPVVHS
jgi:capsular exopolysaccharide synthesis family protein